MFFISQHGLFIYQSSPYTVVLHTVYKSTPSCFSPSKGNSICFLMNQLQLVLRPTTPSLSIYSIWFMNQLHQVFYQSIPSKHSSVNFICIFIGQHHLVLHLSTTSASSSSNSIWFFICQFMNQLHTDIMFINHVEIVVGWSCTIALIFTLTFPLFCSGIEERIKAEEKAKVVASVGGRVYSIPCRTSCLALENFEI